MEQNKSIFYSLRDRSCGLGARGDIRRNILGSTYLVKRLKCEHLFVGHEGCVNSVAWNVSGDVLLSGSDDCKLNIYRLNSMKPVHSIPSGHRANIFSAKFLPGTGDTKVVSCSGDGILHYNDVNSHSFYGQSPFHCHTGTTYEVNTTPGDPHCFLSSGEDGTVRLFDLRRKTKCLCEGCKKDVLIDCKKAVTSFNVNPVYPYYVGVGCGNSMLRVYDRRCLTTDSYRDNKVHGLVHQYKPKALNKRDCRVTSLKYSSDGQSLLASFCSDYIYIFDSNPNTLNQLKATNEATDTTDKEPEAICALETNDQPMKRLRLRGDWSDTGPNARPECEDSGGADNETTFVQRMSGYLTRWIAESLRNSQRDRRRDPTTSRPEDSLERSIHRDENPDSSTVEGSALPPGSDAGDIEGIGAVPEGDVTLESDDDSTNSTNSSQSTTETSRETRDEEHVEQSRSSGVAYKNGGKTCTSAQMHDTPSGECSTVAMSTAAMSTDVDDKTNSSETSTNPSRLQSDLEFGRDSVDTGSKSPGETTCSSATPIVDRGNQDCQRIDGELWDNSGQQLMSVTHLKKLDKFRSITEEVEATMQEPGSSAPDPGIKSPVSGISTRGYVHRRTRDLERTVKKSETNVQSSETQAESNSSTSSSREVSVGDSDQESEDADRKTRRNEAANTIQNFFRNRHKNDWSSSYCGVPVFSEATQIFRGHRNARTMIKEANFWGDDFVLSGSDCGRIFIWARDTAELVMLLDGDRHVVNCVQPHPFDPILATSGIDYDIKLWTPTALKVSDMEDADEVVTRNEKMLKESRDTLTVPASFMIRVLSSLHRVRVNTMDNDHSSGDSDND